MLIVCPNCTTSYMIEPASVGPTGRAVRCARCKTTWFVGAPQNVENPPPQAASEANTGPDMSAFVDSVIAEAEAESGLGGQTANLTPAADDGFAAGARFGADSNQPPPTQSWADLAGFDEPGRNTGMAPRDDDPLFGNDHGRQSGPRDLDGDNFTLADAPSLVPAIGDDPLFDDGQIHDHLRDRDPHPKEDVESFAARREQLKARRQKSKRTSRWTAAMLVLFAFNVALISARSEVVRYLPQTASLFAAIGLPVNLRDLRFDKVRITKESSDGVNILIIEGMIENTANRPTEVPRLRFSARNASGQDVYTWSALPGRSILGPKESVEFHSRLAAPPADATDVMVRFFTPQDAATGIAGTQK